jgi:hypothetical protein
MYLPHMFTVLKMYLCMTTTSSHVRDRRGRDGMVVGFATTYAISTYHH